MKFVTKFNHNAQFTLILFLFCLLLETYFFALFMYEILRHFMKSLQKGTKAYFSILLQQYILTTLERITNALSYPGNSCSRSALQLNALLPCRHWGFRQIIPSGHTLIHIRKGFQI